MLNCNCSVRFRIFF